MVIGLGCDAVDTFISANAIIVTTTSGGEFRTKSRRILEGPVNMDIVARLSRLSHQVVRDDLNSEQVRAALTRIASSPPLYNRWLIVVMIGLACAALSRLFGGDWVVFGITWLSAGVAAFVRQELVRRHVHTLLMVSTTAFVAGLLASSAVWLQLSSQPEIALAASVLLLVPGVPLINMVLDFANKYTVVGLARGVTSALVALSIAVGLLIAMTIAGVEQL
ncbi:MAG: threonine/serine exporter family protein [Chloroflexaceae bacterium]|nr:threonine/serine exporter family protein [Chloroflexaceae bacterium]